MNKIVFFNNDLIVYLLEVYYSIHIFKQTNKDKGLLLKILSTNYSSSLSISDSVSLLESLSDSLFSKSSLI